jgi:hypothetical protein
VNRTVTETGTLRLENLRKVFWLTGAVSLVVAALALPLDPVWSLRYALVAALALVNWVALARVLSGLCRKQPVDIVFGLMIKVFLLVLLLIAGKHGGIEITSFLLGLNTFFLTLFAYLGFRAVFRSGSRELKLEV